MVGPAAGGAGRPNARRHAARDWRGSKIRAPRPRLVETPLGVTSTAPPPHTRTWAAMRSAASCTVLIFSAPSSSRVISNFSSSAIMISTVSRESAPRSVNLASGATWGGVGWRRSNPWVRGGGGVARVHPRRGAHLVELGAQLLGDDGADADQHLGLVLGSKIVC